MTRAATAATTTGRAARTCAAAVAALLTAGLLTACSDSESPQGDPPSSTTATTPETGDTDATSSPDPSEPDVDKPERPAAMDKKNADGAAAAAEYFITLYPFVMTSGDTSTWKAMSFKTCGFCETSIEQAERIRDKGYTWSGGEITRFDVDTTYDRDEATGIYPFDAHIVQNAGHIEDASGNAVFDGETTDDLYRVEVGYIDGDWVVVEIAEKP